MLDEADEMLNMGFADEVERIFDAMGAARQQTLLFSATEPRWVSQMARKYLSDPLKIDTVGSDKLQAAITVTHKAVLVPGRDDLRASLLEDVISVEAGEDGRAIVFTQTKKECDELAGGAAFSRLSAQVLHGDIGQNQRDSTLKQFRNGGFQVLVATDVAARGIDISGIDLVVQYRVPR